MIVSALRDLGSVDAATDPSAEDVALGLAHLNRIVNNWNAERDTVYAQQFTYWTLTPNLSPHTIGPTGTFVVTQRPVSLDGAALVLNNVSPSVNIKIQIVDEAWWMNQTVPSLVTSVPTQVYYQPDWPNGKLYFWPVPNTAYQVLLEYRLVLPEYALSDSLSLPTGYYDALILTLAENLSAPLLIDLPPIIARNAAQARSRIAGNNVMPVRTVTRDAGIPETDSGVRATFNYRSGS